MIPLSVFLYSGAGLLVIALFALVLFFGTTQPTTAPAKGMIGLRRAQLRDGTGLLSKLEPLIRHMGGWFGALPLDALREKVDKQLALAGNWLGLKADEFFALSVLSSIAATGLGYGFALMTSFDTTFVVFATLGGSLYPWIRVGGIVQERFVSINRSLPGGIDLAALCMGAGLDFPGALRQIVEKAGRPGDPLTEELNLILQELQLGRTRRQALENFAERVPTEAVKDFVGSVTQAEEKGNPIAEALRIQATMLRTRRSVMAEESAAKAAVLMMIPMMLIFGAIIIMLMAPFLIQGMNSGF